MGVLEKTNRRISTWFIRDFDSTSDKQVRIQHGLLAGWTSILMTLILFIVKMTLGFKSDSISVVADAFHLLSHLANSIILVLTFWVTAKPATAKTPFGHGRMEHVGPLIMSIFLFISGVQIGERSIHQITDPHTIHYWSALPWILLATILIKAWMGQFVLFLGSRVDSHAILANAHHQRIEAISTITVISGLVAGHFFHIPQIDGYIGIAVSAWILYLGYTHAHNAVIPLLGKAPSKDLIKQIRETAKSVEGIEDVHEIIVHDYGFKYLISLHGEISEKYVPAQIHEIAERCEHKLRKTFGGEAICHSDPILERTPEIDVIETKFKEMVAEDSRIIGYHDFRLIAVSDNQIMIVADIDVSEQVSEAHFQEVAEALEARNRRVVPNLSSCTFYVTPKFAY
ncbi:cation diffusion facilitator family transporter [Thermodesulfobacteriota bacterium]